MSRNPDNNNGQEGSPRTRARRQATRNISYEGMDLSRRDTRVSTWRGHDTTWQPSRPARAPGSSSRNDAGRRNERSAIPHRDLNVRVHRDLNEFRSEDQARRAREQYHALTDYHQPTIVRRNDMQVEGRTFCPCCQIYARQMVRHRCGNEICNRCNGINNCKFCK